MLTFFRRIIRREIGPSAIRVGQIVQVGMSLRLLKQDNEKFTQREILKSISILNEEMSTVRRLSQ
jgi:hypothetical protein